MAARGAKRKRRSAEAAREEILAAAERHLAAGGIEGVRLNAVASDLGLTHQAILRHFGSREELLRELLRRAGRRLRAELASAAAMSDDASVTIDRLVATIGATFASSARVSAWLALAGRRTQGSGIFADAIADLHAQRPAAAQRGADALDETRFAVLLVSLATWSEALVGEALQRAVELPGDAATAQRFRAWLVGVLERELFGAARS